MTYFDTTRNSDYKDCSNMDKYQNNVKIHLIYAGLTTVKMICCI